MTRLTLSQAIVQAISDAMELDDKIYLIGQDVGVFGGPMHSSKGLWERFADTGQLVDAPISEAAMVGTAVGAAMAGSRPIVDLMFGEFLNLAMTPLGLEGASIAYRTKAQVTAPIVVRAKYGVGPHRGHPETPTGALMSYPGLKVVAPTTPQDAYSLMLEAIADPNPVVFLEHMSLLHAGKGEVDPQVTVPIGRANIVQGGSDLTIVATGMMVKRATRAAKALGDDGISVEVIDLRSLKPLDVETIMSSVNKTGALLLLEESWPTAGPMSEVCAQIVRASNGRLDFTVKLLTPPDTPIPFSQTLEASYVPDIATITQAAKQSIREGVPS